MPVPTSTMSNPGSATTSEGKNIWIAAGEGDLERVRHLVQVQGISPTAPDPYTYTPVHAAASYGHLEILRFLLSHPSAATDAVNVTDSDKDTPLFVCEDVETAKLLIEEFGADPKWKNEEGLTPAQQAEENEHEELAEYLRSLTGEVTASKSDSEASSDDEEEGRGGEREQGQEVQEDGEVEQRLGSMRLSSQDQEDDEQAEARMEELMQKVGEIIERSERDSTDPDPELRALVGEAVAKQILEGMDRSTSGNPR